MDIIKRTIQEYVEKSLYKGKIVIIYGARQVGKTTLVRQIEERSNKKTLYLNCDEPDIRTKLSNASSTLLASLFDDHELIIIDEAQRVKNIGLTLKLTVDNLPHVQVIATGSSSFDLSNKVAEPLTGRKYEFTLYPFSIEELSQKYSLLELDRLIEPLMLYGAYPDIVMKQPEAKALLANLTESYLYKDILEFEEIRNPEVLYRLLQALALQVGDEVSYNELAQTVGVHHKTVARYIELLEKAFVIFRLRPYSRNARNALTKLRKVYFFDLGIRNALLNNFNALELRSDKEALWENFVINERLKSNRNHGKFPNMHFWRTYDQAEIDYIEEENGIIIGYECKWKKEKMRVPKAFRDLYPESEVREINRENALEFLRIGKVSGTQGK